MIARLRRKQVSIVATWEYKLNLNFGKSDNGELRVSDIPVTLTDADRAILRELQRDGRLSNQQLAERVNMSASSCWRRVQALEAAGVIAGHVARVSPEAVGLGFSALVLLRLARHETQAVETFARAVQSQPEILECLAITGEHDYALRVVTRDMRAYNAFLSDFLFRQPGVVQVNSSVVMQTVKSTSALPL